MKGLRAQESRKFEKFFEIVQKEAESKGFVFFLDCGQGKTFENNDIECEDLCGWLISLKDATEFEQLFIEDSEKQHDFDDFYVYVDFTVDEKSGEIQIDIDDTPTDLIVDDFSIISKGVEEVK